MRNTPPQFAASRQMIPFLSLTSFSQMLLRGLEIPITAHKTRAGLIFPARGIGGPLTTWPPEHLTANH
jgi:hypothetical protein